MRADTTPLQITARQSGEPSREAERWGLLLLWALALGLLWDAEEPAKWMTLSLMLAVFAGTAGMLRAAHRAGIIADEPAWMVVVLIKLTVTLLIVRFNWILPFQGHRNLASVDFMAYDELGKRLAQSGLSPQTLHGLERGSANGIIWYTGLIYACCGTSTLYVGLVNTLFSLAGILALTGVLQIYDRHPLWQSMRYALLIPDLLFHHALPAKEPLSEGLFYGALYLTCLCFRSGLTPARLGGLGGALLLLLFVRPPQFMVYMVVTGLILPWREWIRPDRIVPFALTVLLIIIALPVLVNRSNTFFAALTPQVQLEMAQGALQHNPSSDPMRRAIGKLLMPDSPLGVVATAPLRTVLVIYGPFPMLVPNLQRIAATPDDYGAWEQEIYQKLTALFVLAITPGAIAGLCQRSCRQSPPYRFMAVSLIVVSLFAANSFVLPILRFRTVILPLLLAMALVGYRYGRVERVARPWYLLVGGACGLVALWSLWGAFEPALRYFH